MSLVNYTIERYRDWAQGNASQRAIDAWLNVREYEIEVLGHIHGETGTFFDDDFGLTIDWEGGKHELHISPSGEITIFQETAFGPREKRLVTRADVTEYLDRVFEGLPVR